MREYTNAVIRKKRLNVEGRTHVMIYYSKKQTKYFPTNVWIEPKFWNKRNQFVKENCNSNDADKLNDIIYSLKKELNSMIEDYRKKNSETPTGIELERIYQQSKFQEIETNSYNLIGAFSSWIDSQINTKSSGSIAIYQQTLNYLNSYVGFEIAPFEIICKNFQFNSLKDVNRKFLEGFRDWLSKRKSKATKEKLSNSTINKQIKNMQRFLRDRNRENEEISMDALLLQLDTEKSRREYLLDREIEAIKKLDIDSINQDKITNRRKHTLKFVRDVFVINLFFGLRFGDLFDLRLSNVHLSDSNEDDNYISLVTGKTNHPIQLPIVHDEIKDLIVKYMRDKELSDYLFPRLSVASYNKSLKLLAKYAGITQVVQAPIYSNRKRINQYVPKWKKISSHSIRKTSINNNILSLGRDLAKIISTHKSESGFAPYVDLSDQEKNRRLIREKIKELQKNKEDTENDS